MQNDISYDKMIHFDSGFGGKYDDVVDDDDNFDRASYVKQPFNLCIYLLSCINGYHGLSDKWYRNIDM